MQRTHGGNITDFNDLTVPEHVSAGAINAMDELRQQGFNPRVAGVEHYDTVKDRQNGLLNLPNGARQSHAAHIATLNPFAARENQPVFLTRQLHFHSGDGFQGGRWRGDWS